MWLFYTFLCTAAWGAADFFYKLGSAKESRYSHLKTSVWVGFVMGAHALFELARAGFEYDFRNLLVYLPVSAMYILSMTLGYFGLRYLELSISSPVQNTSGALVCILCMIFLREIPDALSGAAIVLICVGVFWLGLLEYREARREPTVPGDRKYMNGFKAFMFPLAYCVIDALGTFFDAWYLDDPSATPLIGATEENVEFVANTSYELTFFAVALVLFVYIRFIRREKFIDGKKTTLPRFFAAAFETGGQFAYVYAMSGNAVVAAPVVAAYCMVAVLLSRVFLKEKLSPLKYVTIGLALVGIVLLGVADGLSGA